MVEAKTVDVKNQGASFMTGPKFGSEEPPGRGYMSAPGRAFLQIQHASGIDAPTEAREFQWAGPQKFRT